MASRKDEDSLTPQRRQLLRAIRRRPGITITELMNAMPFGWASLYHHLDQLVAAKLIHLEENPYDARKRHVFPSDAPADVHAMQTVLRPTRRQVAETVRDNPGIGADEIAKRLGLTRQQVIYHLRLMHERGLVSSRAAEPFARVHPRKQLIDLLRSPVRHSQRKQ